MAALYVGVETTVTKGLTCLDPAERDCRAGVSSVVDPITVAIGLAARVGSPRRDCPFAASPGPVRSAQSESEPTRGEGMSSVELWKVDSHLVFGEGAGRAGAGLARAPLAAAHQHLRTVVAFEEGRAVVPIGHRAIARGLHLRHLLVLFRSFLAVSRNSLATKGGADGGKRKDAEVEIAKHTPAYPLPHSCRQRTERKFPAREIFRRCAPLPNGMGPMARFFRPLFHRHTTAYSAWGFSDASFTSAGVGIDAARRRETSGPWTTGQCSRTSPDTIKIPMFVVPLGRFFKRPSESSWSRLPRVSAHL